MIQPLVTIVIPTRNRAAMLKVAVHSVLCAAAEAERRGIRTRVLVIDDASATRDTADVCAGLGVECGRLDRHEGPADPARAIVHGVRLVRSRYFALFGDDDVMLARHIRAHVQALESGHDVCAGSFLVVDDDLRVLEERVLPQPHLGDLLAGSVMVNDGAMVRTELVHDVPLDPSLDRFMLYPLWLELMLRGARFTRLTEPTWCYRRHDGNISGSPDPHDAARRGAIRERFASIARERLGFVPQPSATEQNPA